MFRIFFITLFIVIGPGAIAQKDPLPDEVKQFILPGYEYLDHITGDLNNDKKADAILVLKIIGEDSLYDNFNGEGDSAYSENPRPLLLLIRQADGKLKQIIRNDKAIMCRHCGGVFGDPYEGISIHPGGFDINFYGGSSWRWAYHFSFLYKPLKKNWYLVKEIQTSFQAGDPEATRKDVTITESESGEVPVEKFQSESKYEDSKWKVIAAKTYFYDNPKPGSKPRKGYLLKGNQVTGIRHLKNFIEVSFENDKGVFTTGFILKKDLLKLK